MIPSDTLKALVNDLPDADSRGMLCASVARDKGKVAPPENPKETIDKAKIEKIIADIAKGGKENVLGLIDMLGEPGSDPDMKPHYALHGVANHVLKTKDEKARQEFAEAVASQLSSDRSKYIRAFLCQELQCAGRKEAVPALAKLLTDEELVDPAALALVAIKDGAPEVLRAAAPGAKGRCRLVIVHSLAALADPGAAEIFREALKDSDREVRIAAGAGLARIGDATAADPLVKAADAASGWERIQQTKHCLVLAEKLAAAGKKPDAAKIYAQLGTSRTDPSEKYIRESAERGLAAVK